MGIKNLNQILKKYCNNGIKKININELKNKFIAIDTSIYIYKFSYMGNMLDGFLNQIEHLLKNNITPLYLFDGKPGEDKNKLITKRKETLKKNKDLIETLKNKKNKIITDFNENNNNEDNIEDLIINIDLEISKKEKNTIIIDYNNVNKLKEILKNLGIFYYECNGETDIYISSFFKNNIIDYVITEDLDFLTHGCNNVLYNYKYNSNKLELYNLNLILIDLKIDYSSFIDMCVILGCDYYLPGIKGCGPKNTYKYITKFKNIENIKKNIKKFIIPEDLNHVEIFNIFNNDIEINVNKENVKIHIDKINFKYFENTNLNLLNIINLIKNMKYKKNILDFFKKKN